MKRTSIFLIGLGLFLTALFLYQYTSIARHEDFFVAHHFGLLTARLKVLTYFFAAFLILLWLVTRKLRELPAKTFWIITLVVFLAVAALALASHPTRSQDSYWSLLLAKGYTQYHLNPYATQPAQLATDAWAYPVLTWKDITMIYGPVWTLWVSAITYLVHTLGSAVLLLKISFLAVLVGCGAVLWRIMGLLNIPIEKKQATFLLLAWNPFVIQIALVDMHNDLLLMASLLASLYFLLKKNYALSMIALVLGGLVKYISWIFLLIPLYYLIRDVHMNVRRKVLLFSGIALVAIALVFIAYLPFGGLSIKNLVGLSTQIERIGLPSVFLPGTALMLKLFQINFEQLRWLGMLAAIAVMALCLHRKRTLLAYTLPLIVIFFFATPWFQPWYGLWLLPLISLYLPLSIITVTSIFLMLTPELATPAQMSIVIPAYAFFAYAVGYFKTLLGAKKI